MKPNNVKSRLERAKERDRHLKVFLASEPTAMAATEVTRRLERLHLKRTLAQKLAEQFDASVRRYSDALHGERVRAEHDVVARKAHSLAKKALRELERIKVSLPKFVAAASALTQTLKNMNSLKSAATSEYVLPIMRYGIVEQTVRMATGQLPPRCQHPACPRLLERVFCRCKVWPSGSATSIDAFAEFEYPRVPSEHSLDPQAYGWAGAVGLLRLYIARFDPGSWKNKKGPSEPCFDQALVDELCRTYEEESGGGARHDISAWRHVFTNVLEVYGLQFLDTENRLKRYEAYMADQRKRYGSQFLPRGVSDQYFPLPPLRGRLLTKASRERERSLKSQLVRQQIEFELFDAMH